MDHEEDTEVEEGLINRNKTMIKSETNKWADIYNERDCPFDLAYMIERDGFWINDSSKGNIYLDDPYTLLSSILEYIGIYNFDDKDCYQVLEFLYKNIDFCYDGNNILDKLTDKMVDDIFFQNNNVSDNLKHRAHLLCEKYVNTILCLLCDKNLIDYGINLQHCWISPKGRWIVENRDLCIKRIEEIKANGDV